ncbi:MAG: hypothetical protein KBS62_03460 [Oscillospiraceae bacterium]|nr:hypothetical protein [Candidatus Ruminococcus equi]
MSGSKMIDTQLMNTVFGNALPPKMGNKGNFLNDSIIRSLRVMDEQNAINRFVWYNLPLGLSQNLLERILYYRGTGMFFYMQSNDKFYFLPYVGSQVDVYGRYVEATPLPFNGSTTSKDEKPWLDKRWTISYDIELPDNLTEKTLFDNCVLLNDYSKQMSQKILPRERLQEPLLQVMSECVPFLRTALLNGVGIEGIRVNNADESYSVQMANNALTKAGIVGDRWIPVESGIQTEVLNHNSGTTVEEYMVALQSLDNMRLSWHGLDNGGIFQKKAHVLQSEQDMNTGSAGMVLQDCLSQRQEFCNIVNSIWGLGIWCDIAEVSADADLNADGVLADEQNNAMAQDNSNEEGGEE